MVQCESPYDFIRDHGFEVVFTTLRMKEDALDEDYWSGSSPAHTGTGTKDDFPIAQLQLSGETTNVQKTHHQAKELV